MQHGSHNKCVYNKAWGKGCQRASGPLCAMGCNHRVRHERLMEGKQQGLKCKYKERKQRKKNNVGDSKEEGGGLEWSCGFV